MDTIVNDAYSKKQGNFSMIKNPYSQPEKVMIGKVHVCRRCKAPQTRNKKAVYCKSCADIVISIRKSMRHYKALGLEFPAELKAKIKEAEIDRTPVIAEIKEQPLLKSTRKVFVFGKQLSFPFNKRQKSIDFRDKMVVEKELGEDEWNI